MVIISTHKIFISYSSHEKDTADTVCTYLENHGKKCWIAPRDIPAGTEYGEEIINGLESSDALVLIFSKASNESQHVMREVERAVNKKIPIISFKIEECTLSKSMEYFLLSNQWLDATSGVDVSLEALNLSVDNVYRIAAKTSDGTIAPTSTIRVTNKAVPIVLGVIAVGIVAIAVILAVTAGKNSVPVSGDPSVTSQSEITAGTDASESVQTTLAEAELPEFAFGEYVNFARYNPSTSDSEGVIKWQILDVDKEAGTMKMISAEIIDIKPYDCAEGGNYGYDCDGIEYDYNNVDYSDAQYMEFFGSNDWLSSDLWAWLNATGAPHYTGLFQNDAATDE